MKSFLLILLTTVAATALYGQQKVVDIPLPAGYSRVAQERHSFGEWLRSCTLKSDKIVYLYNGALKKNQQAQYAVLNIPVGEKDLQQCADAVIRLRAEYFYSSGRAEAIAFKATDGTRMDYSGWLKGDRFLLQKGKLLRKRAAAPAQGRALFEKYLETVFAYAGTVSLSGELKQVQTTKNIQPGDVFIQGGSPGHAVIVMDVAQNRSGKKIFLLAQSYMPAQNIHILKNPAATTPWYDADYSGKLYTPEWVFGEGALKRW
ncbi:protein of unknown function (4846) [Chitinophaga eiseniae]|uniref:DUF4846 domain-containing protein n=1 Tax=Chitinophaga eiseniae TaxID=634771 RepID=A0A1T4TKV6_9BACT|nr:DUF4846 domain-containing protein [Chitinophaga eiseniae]SKA41143.1 protein of unknown function (4846) [Chitinophaga eiseniae]